MFLLAKFPRTVRVSKPNVPEKVALPVDNDTRDQIIVDLKQGKDGYDPMTEEEVAQTMGISTKRVYAIVESFLGARNFTSKLYSTKRRKE